MLPEACGVIQDFTFCRDKSLCETICSGSLCSWLEPDHFYNLLVLARRYGSANISKSLTEFENVYGAACPLRHPPNETIDLVKGHSAKIIHKYFTIPDCADSCVFGCSLAAIDDWEFSQLAHKGIAGLKLFECDSFPNWLLIAASIVLITTFFGIFIFIVFFVCSPEKTANIHAEASKDDEGPTRMEIPLVVIESPRDSFANDDIFS